MPSMEVAQENALRLANDTSVVPHGPYCYTIAHGSTSDGRIPIKPCPYWALSSSQPEGANGYCALLKLGDWMEHGTFMLWDQVKECDHNLDLENDSLAGAC